VNHGADEHGSRPRSPAQCLRRFINTNRTHCTQNRDADRSLPLASVARSTRWGRRRWTLPGRAPLLLPRRWRVRKVSARLDVRCRDVRGDAGHRSPCGRTDRPRRAGAAADRDRRSGRHGADSPNGAPCETNHGGDGGGGNSHCASGGSTCRGGGSCRWRFGATSSRSSDGCCATRARAGRPAMS